jgi:60 kDa SS-A/Ro ribonucleoprotein
MAKYATAKAARAKKEKMMTENYVGEAATKLRPEMELTTILLTSFMEDSYYRKAEDTLGRIRELIPLCDPLFLGKAAIYTRHEFGMRSVSHVLAAELAKILSGKPFARKFYEKIIRRPDDMLEILGYYFDVMGEKKLANAVKEGFARAFGKFDDYQLGKWRGEKKSVKLIDALRLAHPKAAQRNGNALKDLVYGELRSKKTWEKALSKAGKDAKEDTSVKTDAERDELRKKLKEAAWEEVVVNKDIAYEALLKNLRNIVNDSPKAVEDACALLQDEKRLRKSLLFPFHFLTAYEEIEKLKKTGAFESKNANIGKVLNALEKAINITVANIPSLGNQVVILSDNSGSMKGDGGGSSAISANSKRDTASIANLFAVLYWLKSNDTIVGLFGDKLIYPTLDRDKGVFDNYKIINKESGKTGLGTETGIFTMFKRLVDEKIMVDSVVIFSDTQIGAGCGWYGSFGRGDSFMKLLATYRKMNPNFLCVSVDLKGYGTTVFDDKTLKVAGFSDKIFSIIHNSAKNAEAVLAEIEKVDL